MIAIDGTKVHANASHHSNLDYEQLAREILKEAGDVDACEDELYGQARGDELPEHLRTHEGRRAALREARHQLDEHRRLAADPIPRSRPERLLECERRLQENLRVEREANDEYEHHRATAVMKDGRRFGARPNPLRGS